VEIEKPAKKHNHPNAADLPAAARIFGLLMVLPAI
jgi:hypothetical protein